MRSCRWNETYRNLEKPAREWPPTQAFLGEHVFHPGMKDELPEKRLRGRLVIEGMYNILKCQYLLR